MCCINSAAKNNFGVLDHEVTLPSGEKVLNPMRVFPNCNGSELVFTVYQLPGRADEEYLEDTQMVAHDFKNIERNHGGIKAHVGGFQYWCCPYPQLMDIFVEIDYPGWILLECRTNPKIKWLL